MREKQLGRCQCQVLPLVSANFCGYLYHMEIHNYNMSIFWSLTLGMNLITWCKMLWPWEQWLCTIVDAWITFLRKCKLFKAKNAELLQFCNVLGQFSHWFVIFQKKNSYLLLMLLNIYHFLVKQASFFPGKFKLAKILVVSLVFLQVYLETWWYWLYIH